jgi:hypothetical protein
MSYNTNATITLTNNFSGAANVTLTHEYSDEGLYSNRWLNIPPGTSGNSRWQVGYNTGLFRYGKDYWSIQVEVQSGEQSGVWRSNTFQCTLKSEDANQVVQVAVAPSGMQITKPSGNWQQPLQKIA